MAITKLIYIIYGKKEKKNIYVDESYAGRSCITTLSLTTNCSAINTAIERKMHETTSKHLNH